MNHFGINKEIEEYLDKHEKFTSCIINISMDCSSLILKNINESNLFINIEHSKENDSDFIKAGMIQCDFKHSDIVDVIKNLKKIIRKYRCPRDMNFYSMASRYSCEYEYNKYK